MQRTRDELKQMTHEELVERVLELQDILREGLAVRDSLHRVLNGLLKAKADEVAEYAGMRSDVVSPEEKAVRQAWANARHAVSNPFGVVSPKDRERLEQEKAQTNT